MACPKGHGPAELPQEGNWTQVKEIRDISGLSHGIGWCAPQQGCCKLTLNVKNGVIQEALVETTGCTGATHGAAVAGEHLPGKTLLEALNTHLACDAINVAMREIFKQMVYGRTQTAFRKTVCPSALRWRTWARVCAASAVRFSPPWKKAPVCCRWPRAMCWIWP